MRRNLFKYVNKELWFEGTIEKFSFSYKKEKNPISPYHRKQLYPTVLISDIIVYADNTNISHFWIIVPCKENVISQMKIGNRIRFKAKVEEYRKRNRHRDVGINDLKGVNTLYIDEKYINEDRKDFSDWWMEERYKHKITKLCFYYDEIVVKCRRKKFFKKSSNENRRKNLNGNRSLDSIWTL